MAADEVAITLTQDDFSLLLLMMGFAAGAAFHQKNKRMAYCFLGLANRVNRDNPRWRPYEIPDEFKSEAAKESV